jgi:hypothetical protein
LDGGWKYGSPKNIISLNLAGRLANILRYTCGDGLINEKSFAVPIYEILQTLMTHTGAYDI